MRSPKVNRALGVYVHDSAWDFAMLDQYARLVGAVPTFAASHFEFESTTGDNGEKFPDIPVGYAPQMSGLEAWEARSIAPHLTWQPFRDWTEGAVSDFALSTITAGNHDATIDVWASHAAAYAKPLYIRFAHEMNGDWYPWGQGLNGNTPAQYVAAWRYVVDRFRAAGALNVLWSWSPSVVGSGGQYPLTGLYPGDAYVDLIGMDGYNWGTTGRGDGGWRSFTDVFATTYDQLAAHGKPMYVAETNSADLGGDKAKWITSAFLSEIPKRFPNLRGVLLFDPYGAIDPAWAVTGAALNALRRVTAEPTWTAVLP